MKNFRKIFIVIFITTIPLFALSQIDFGSLTQEEIEALKNSEADKLKYWIGLAEGGIIPFNPDIPVKAAEYRVSKDGTKNLDNMSTDVCILNVAGNTQSENSVFIDPDDDEYALNSNNSFGPGFYGSNYIQTSNGGSSWSGSINGAGIDQSGDPAACIGTNGRQYVGFIDNNDGQGIAYSDNGTSWTYVSVVGDPGVAGFADKNHMMINNVGGTYNGYIYDAWYHLANNNSYKETVISRSTNNGVSWSTPVSISTGVTAGHHNQGVNIQIGPAGQVYAVWAIYDSWGPNSVDYREDALGFARSLNGGASYYSAIRCIDNIMGIRHSSTTWSTNLTGKSMRVNSFPSMAVDVSGGPRNGYIYVVWANLGTPGTNTGTNVSIYMIRSTNGGVSWSTPIRVNQGSFVSDKAAFLPWITCDPHNGRLYCIFYDDRNFSTTSADVETWVAYSEDGGLTWDDFVVSDVSFTPSAIPGTAGGYMGDYLGIAAQNNRVYPVWTDNRSGTALTYTSPLHFSDACIAMGGCDEYISNVSIGTINNSSDCEGYSNYTDQVASMPVNGSETVTVTIGDPWSSDDITVWVDWNKDDDFDDVDEMEGYATGYGPHDITITPPASATLGQCTMRIRLSYNGTPPALPCGSTTYGEVEDYTLNLTAPLPNYWTGAYNYYWHNENNWSLGHIPTGIETVYITNDGYNPPSVDYYDDECNNLIIEAGAGLIIADQTLTINNDLTVFGNLNMNNTASKCYVYHDVFWESGSTGSMTGSARMYVYEDWDFKSGANVQLNAGYVEFLGTANSWIRSHDADCHFNHLNNSKTGLYGLAISEISTADLHINGSIYNYSGNLIRFRSTQSVYVDGYFNNMGGHFEGQDGTFVFNGYPSTIGLKPNTGDYFNNLIINTTSALSLDNTYSNELFINGNIEFQGGSLDGGDFDIYVGGDWTSSGGTFTPGTSNVIFTDQGVDNDVNGTSTFNNVVQANTNYYLRFNGNTTINNNLTLNYFCWAYNTFNVNGTLSVDNPSSKFTANGAYANATIASLNQGGTIFCNGTATLTINDLFESSVQGTYVANNPGGVINLSNGGSFIDLGGNLLVYGGTINMSGSLCYWPWMNNASVTMTDGVIDITDCSLRIYNSSTYSLNDNITGGKIRMAGGFNGDRADFTPTSGLFEFYGPNDVTIMQANGCILPDVNIDKLSSDGLSPIAPAKIAEDGRVDKMIGSTKANTVTLASDFTITNNLAITSGSLALGGYELSVNNYIDVYGTLTMDNPADVLISGNGYWDQLNFYSGSTANLTQGVARIYGWVIPREGCNFNCGTGHTFSFMGNEGGGPSNFEPTATYGNIQINKFAGQKTFIDNMASHPIIVNGNLDVLAGNIFELQNETVIVHGYATDISGSQITAYDVAKDSNEKNSSGKTNDFVVNPKPPIDPENLDGAKGGYFEIDNDFTLNGILDVGDGEVLVHGNFGTAATGIINIDGGSIIADMAYADGGIDGESNKAKANPENTKAWQFLNGTLNFTDGLFEISHNSFNFSSSSTNNISGGLMKCGGGFAASAGVLNPTGGNLEMTGDLIDANMSVNAPSSLFNLIINTSGNTVHYNADLTVSNDLSILNGNLECGYAGSYMLAVGRHWLDNSAGFIPNTGTVSFYSGMYADIITDETFYNMEVNKMAAGFDGLEMASGITINVLNNLNLPDGTLEMNNNSTLNVAKDVNIAYNAGLNAGGLDVGLILNIGGNWTDNNPEYNTIRGYTPGEEVITFNGSTNQVINTDAPQEEFGYLVIDKNAGYFSPNDNIRVIYDLQIIDGEWEDFSDYKTHFFEGDFIVEPNGAFFTHNSPNTAVFKGLADQDINYLSNAGYFCNVVIDKTEWQITDFGEGNFEPVLPKKIISDMPTDFIPAANDSPGSKAMGVTLLSNVDMEWGQHLTIDEGTLHLNGHSLSTMGNIEIMDGGTLIVNEGATLKVYNEDYLNVNDGGMLEVIGLMGNQAHITRRGITGNYNFHINSGGTISAEHAMIEYMGGNGVFVTTNGIVNTTHAFNYCTFQNGFPGYSPLLVFNNNQTLTCTGANFPQTGVTDFNVAKAVAMGEITMINATGDFMGPAYEFDPEGRIHWEHEVILEAHIYLEGPFNGTGMTTSLNSSLPISQPFNVAPYWGGIPDWNYTGSESVPSIPNTNIADWVLVELRDAASALLATPATSVVKQPAFVLNDGSIVDLDGSSNLSFDLTVSSGLYLVVWHRNHLGVISANALSNDGGTYPYDFTTAASQAYGGTSAMSQMAPGKWAMKSGDGNGNSEIDQFDILSVWKTWAGYFYGYSEADFNMDKQVNNIDKNDKWAPNFGASTYVPN